MLLSKFILVLIPVMVSVAFYTLLERKVLGLVGIRISPNKVFLGGFLQPISDAVKLSNKHYNFLMNFSSYFFYVSSILMLCLSLFLWSCLDSVPNSVALKYIMLILMLVLGGNSLNSIISGWSSFGKYPLLGSLRTVSQLISYESCLYLCFIFSFLFYLSFVCSDFQNMMVLFLVVPICFYCWWPSFLAELNRTPYDFSEGESELVSGFNTEFGANCFTLIFLAEYANILFFSVLTVYLFFSVNQLFYSLSFLLLVLWVRSVVPRYRFDKLMSLAWKFIIPFLTCCLLFYI